MNKLLRLPLITLFVLISFVNYGQENKFQISGQILDQANKEPIPFASIYLKGKSIGTTSNEEGFFVFNLPTTEKNSTIIISMIGYTTLAKEASTFRKNEVIYLSSKPTKLDEVVITATKEKKLTAKEIVRKAYSEIKNNYPTQPYILEGYVRDLQKEDNNYVEYLECATKFLYQSYKISSEPQVELLGVRTNYLAKKHPWNEDKDRKNSVIDLVEDDFIRFDYGPIKGRKGWKYELEDILPYNEGLVYKITAIDKPFQTATLFIDTETFAFVRMELTREAIKNRSWRRRFTNGALQVGYNVIFEYQEFNNKMYLKYQKEEDIWKIFNGLETRELLFTQHPKKELFINKIVTDSIDYYPFTRNMNIGTSIEKQSDELDSAFWSTYNIPKQTEAESKIISELKNRTQ